jgi:glycosyltransferase involved in cell wall biosynthesis
VNTEQSPLVSIGVPVYNGQRFLREALDSLVGQTYRNLEIVICDNASTDHTPEICAEYVARDSRVRYFRNETNLGVVGNYRRVFALSTGDYFTWGASDDLRPPQAIADAVEAFRQNPTAVMGHGPVDLRLKHNDSRERAANEMDLLDPDGATRIRTFTRQLRHNGMLYGLYRRTALARATLGEHYGQDYLVCLKVCQSGPVAYMTSPIIEYRERGEPLTSPMYRPVRLSLRNLLFYRGVMRSKCWAVLMWGCYYLSTDRAVAPGERLRTVNAHVSTFIGRYRRELWLESAYLATAPLMWIMRPVNPLAQKIVAGFRRRRDARGLRSA